MGDDYCIPNFSQSITKRTIVNIFEACKYRSQLVVCFLHDEEVATKYGNWMGQGSGTITKVIVADESNIMVQLHDVFRNVGTLLLSGVQMFIFIIASRSLICNDTAKSITWAFRGSYVDLREFPRGSQSIVAKLEEYYKLSPLISVPKMGQFYYGPTVFSELLSISNKNRTSWRYVIDYSMFTRSGLVGFMSKVASSLDYKSKVLNVIGYNPPYVWAGLRHSMMIRYIESSVPDPSGSGPMKLILPKLDAKVLESKVKYVLHNPQVKLLCSDSLILSLSKNVLYLGAYPAEHLREMKLKGWKIVAVDPKLDDVWADGLSKNTGAKIIPYSQKFTFDAVSTKDVILKNFNNVSFAVIDDTWVEGDSEYQEFQDVKQSYFEQLVSSKDDRIKVSLISMKWNRKKDVKCCKLIGLLPQPYGGSLMEMRAYFHSKGCETMVKRSEVDEYMDKFSKLSSSDQISTQKFMHIFITKSMNAMNMKLGRGESILASYSLSNAINDKDKVLEFLDRAVKSETFIIFGAPNLPRVKFMLANGVVTGSDISVKKDVITFKNASGRTWKDYGYTQSELLKVGMVEMTIEQMVSYAGGDYNGVGYFANSIYNDMFSWYIPKWLFEKLFQTQDVRLSPVALVKCFTTRIRNLCYVPHATYYALRGVFVERLLIRANVLNSSYKIDGQSDSTFQVLSNFNMDSEAGTLTFLKGQKVNISGHLLSLTIAAHFVASPIVMWSIHMKKMTASSNLPSGVDKLLFFDNKIKNGKLEPWHSKEEVVLAAMIAGDYVSHILNGHHSTEIVDDICKTIYEQFK
uniref:Uncharacterized protein n=1 Tax=Tobacco leaf enation phytoreovirus TaxID=288891 RepID=A2RQI3_9REOV|nr:unknown [Tobacco leaf enation phytoreovirus]